MIDRRNFIQRTTVAGSAVVAGALCYQDGDKKDSKKSDQKKSNERKRQPRLELDIVKEFVGVSHGNFDRVKEMLKAETKLVNAVHDWGGGDFESALGAASHVGNRKIAVYLLENGARMNIFCATMLGRLDIVKPMLEAYPALVHNRGPHGIPLLKHAEYGRYEAKAVYEFIKTLLEENPKAE